MVQSCCSALRFSPLDFHSAYLLVFHGSRDPRPHATALHVAGQVRDRLKVMRSTTDPDPWVSTGVLELADPLHQQIWQLYDHLRPRSYRRLMIVPLFLLPGVHVMEDIPRELAIAQAQLGTDLPLIQSPYLGCLQGYPQMPDLIQATASPVSTRSKLDSKGELTPVNGSAIAQPFVSSANSDWATSFSKESDSARILLAHGSRRPGGNQPVEAIAQQIGATPAYWAVPPDLTTIIDQTIAMGYRQILILPYFLFSGGTTDAIAQQVQQLAQQYPTCSFSLASPIGDSPVFVDRILSLMSHACLHP